MSDEPEASPLFKGSAVRFEDRDQLLETLDRLDRRVPPRHRGRSHDDREHFVMLRYLRFLGIEAPELLPLPATLSKVRDDPPDFRLQWDDGREETFEVTEGSTSEYQRQLSRTSQDRQRRRLPVDPRASDGEAAERWADILFQAFRVKSEKLKPGCPELDHLLIYDLSGLGLFVPIEDGAALLRAKILTWQEGKTSRYRFERVSVLRDQELWLDVGGAQRHLRGKSPHFDLPILRAGDSRDLRRRLREIDRYCRENSIRHLKLFGSVLGDRADGNEAEDLDQLLFRNESDLDLLVEFEPGTRVTLLDMARMEKDLSELTGFPVDLRTAADLSRYFRRNVLEEAVELYGSPG